MKIFKILTLALQTIGYSGLIFITLNFGSSFLSNSICLMLTWRFKDVLREWRGVLHTEREHSVVENII